jgi:hypothetical protein
MVAHEISSPQSCLFNCCIGGGRHYPAFFKVARVRPVFKSEDPMEFSNYRPISMLPVLSQLFERVLQEKLVGFMRQQGIITLGQYGFRAGHSTTMAIRDMVKRIRGAWSSKNVALGVFIDLKKAFNTDHEVLLAKLDHYGVREGALELLAYNVVYNGGEIREALGGMWGPLGFSFGAIFSPLCQ